MTYILIIYNFKDKIGQMSLIRLLVAAGLLCSTSFVQAACDAYDLETVYGAYGFLHSVTDFHYAIDTTTFDIVAGGTIARVDAR